MKQHLSLLFSLFLLLGSLSAGKARGENRIFVALPPVTYDSTGVPKEPASVQAALVQGGVDPGLQLAFQNYLLGQCVEKVLSEGPNQRTSYKNAYQKFTSATCTLARCFQRGMMLDFLAQSSPNPENGGTESQVQQAALKNIADSLAKNLSTNACPTSSPK